jgi:WD40 repeat protein
MAGELANCFISFALSDREFVRDLVEAFKKNGHIIWTDWERSSPFENRAQEHYSRIEAADYFLFVVSTESVASADCLKELTHAVEHKKQIVPIIRGEVELTHPALVEAHSPLLFRRVDNFNEAFNALLRVVNTEINLAVFISYSRRDREFTRNLETAFREKGRKVWIDQKDIQHTEEWLKAIYSGIEAADNFIFIISPDAIVSENCAKEVAHAVKHNKRLIPVLYREVNDKDVPEHLAELDWVPFQQEADFNAAFEILLEAIDTDLEYVRSHTRLLTRAIEWNKQQRDKSLLLRGKLLKEAEQWRSEAIQKKPAATPLQLEYIEASRKAADRRLWTIAGASVLALAIISTLTIVAVMRSREAQRQARSTLSSRLAGEAQKQIEGQLDLALLLSLEAGNAADTFEARSALLSGLMRSTKLTTFLRGQSNVPYSMAYSPDGKMLAVGTDGASVLFWNANTWQLIDPPITGTESTVTTIAFSPDGKTLATGGYTPDVRLWDVSSRQQQSTLPLPDDDFATSVLFSADGHRLLVGTDKGRIIIWSVDSKQLLAQVFEEDFRNIGRVVFIDAGSKVAAFTSNGTLIVWSNSTTRPASRLLTTDMVMGMDFSPDGQMLAVRHPDAVAVYDVNSAELRFKISTEHMNGIKNVSFSRDSQKLAVAEGNGDIFLCDVRGRYFRDPPLLGHNKEIYSLAFSPDGKTLVSGGLDKNVLVWNVEGDRSLGQTLAETSEEITRLVFAPDGKTVFAASSDKFSVSSSRSAISEWDVSNRRQLNHFTPQGNSAITSLRLLNDRKILTAGLDETIIELESQRTPGGSVSTLSNIERNVVVWDGANSPRVLDHPRSIYQSSAAAVTLSRDGGLVAAGLNNGKVITWQVGQWQESGGPLVEHKARINALDFSPDGKLLASGSIDRNVIVWSLQTRQPIGRISFPKDQDVRTLAFNENGTMLAVGTTQSITLWDVVNRRSLDTSLVGQQGSATCLAFSPDGSMLAAGSFNKSIVLWDVAARKPIGTALVGHTQQVRTVSFSNDGQTLASGSSDGKIILWDLRLGTWRSRACEIANRNLTAEEWNRYLGNEQPRKTCGF